MTAPTRSTPFRPIRKGLSGAADSRRRASAVVVVPTANEAATIGAITRALVGLIDEGVCDRVLVVDESTDDTARIARANGAVVLRQSELQPQLGPVLGKGDAMWRALSVVREDIVVFVDGDTRGFDPQVARDLIAAVRDDGAHFVKATYERPWDEGGVVRRHGGGRVTELVAKPLLRRFFPALGQFGQPLAGEIAGRTALLRRLPFVTGYGVDVALLIDAWRLVGSSRLAEVHAGPRQNRHRPLAELAHTSDAVIGAIFSRAGVDGGGGADGAVERPALVTLLAAGAARSAPAADSDVAAGSAVTA